MNTSKIKYFIAVLGPVMLAIGCGFLVFLIIMSTLPYLYPSTTEEIASYINQIIREQASNSADENKPAVANQPKPTPTNTLPPPANQPAQPQNPVPEGHTEPWEEATQSLGADDFPYEKCDALPLVKVEVKNIVQTDPGTIDASCHADIYFSYAGPGQESIGIQVRKYVETENEKYINLSTYQMGPDFPDEKQTVFLQAYKRRGYVGDVREYAVVLLTRPEYRQGCIWVMTGPDRSEVVYSELPNPCR